MTTTIAPIPTLDEIRAAGALLEGVALRTPTERSTAISAIVGTDVLLKFENRQYTNSFKMRGAYMKIRGLDVEQRARGVIAASAGNHAQGVAYAARSFGVPATIVMPIGTPFGKVRRTQEFGGRVVLEGSRLVDSLAVANALAQSEGLAYVSGYDDPAIVAGAGTVALEMLEDAPDLDVLVVPVGGGGLIGGVAIAAKALHPKLRIVGAQSASFQAGESTVAEGIAVKEYGALNAQILAEFVDEMLPVDEASIETAIFALLDREKTLVEGAGAAGVAALLQYPQKFKGLRVGAILSGGNIDPSLLASIIARAGLRDGRMAKLRTQMLDIPGGLAKVAGIIARHGANVIEVVHARTHTDLPAKAMELETTIELRSPEDLADILSDIRATGLPCDIAPIDRYGAGV
jgi:threonine dehydratase